MQAVNNPSKKTQGLPKKHRSVITNSIQTNYTTFLKKIFSENRDYAKKRTSKLLLKNPNFQEYSRLSMRATHE